MLTVCTAVKPFFFVVFIISFIFIYSFFKFVTWLTESICLKVCVLLGYYHSKGIPILRMFLLKRFSGLLVYALRLDGESVLHRAVDISVPGKASALASALVAQPTT